MSILNPTKRGFERGTDDFIKQAEAEADHTVGVLWLITITYFVWSLFWIFWRVFVPYIFVP
jgi:hypothetical protein